MTVVSGNMSRTERHTLYKCAREAFNNLQTADILNTVGKAAVSPVKCCHGGVCPKKNSYLRLRTPSNTWKADATNPYQFSKDTIQQPCLFADKQTPKRHHLCKPLTSGILPMAASPAGRRLCLGAFRRVEKQTITTCEGPGFCKLP